MNKSRTRHKLNEAAFFLGKLESQVTEFPNFNYMLSAFVSAARSVIWVMKAEHKQVLGFLEWYDAKVPTLEEKQLLSKINDVRTRSVKSNPLQTIPTIVAEVATQDATPELRAALENRSKNSSCALISHLDNGTSVTLELPDADTSTPTVLQWMERRIPEFPEEDVVKVCRRYLNLVEQLVSEWEARDAT
jgi:hypothetical protein